MHYIQNNDWENGIKAFNRFCGVLLVSILPQKAHFTTTMASYSMISGINQFINSHKYGQLVFCFASFLHFINLKSDLLPEHVPSSLGTSSACSSLAIRGPTERSRGLAPGLTRPINQSMHVSLATWSCDSRAHRGY